MRIKFRNLEAGEIECRLAKTGKMGVDLLIYKDARVDMNILDETVGQENWQCDYKECKGILFCKIGINVSCTLKYIDPVEAEPRWIWKEDAGSESNQEAEKGNASDAFKRAAFRWGIGRALYTAPNIHIFATDQKGVPQVTITERDGRYYCYDKFSVEKIAYSEDGRRITGLAIRNETLNKRVFVWQEKQ